MVHVQQIYHIEYVLLSIIVSILASYITINLLEKMRECGSEKRKGWLFVGAAVFSVGVWTMHSLGMIAYEVSISFTYDWIWTLLSFVAVLFFTLGAFSFLLYPQGLLRRLLIAGLFLSAGILVMHYTGMHAINVDAMMHVSRWSVILALFLALLTSFSSLFLFLKKQMLGYSWVKSQWIAALLLGSGVAGVHYIAMAGTSFSIYPLDVINAGNQSQDISFITNGIWISVISLVALMLFLAYFDKYQALKESTARALQYDSLFFNSPNMLCVIDKFGNMKYANERFTERMGDFPGDPPSLYSYFKGRIPLKEKIEGCFHEDQESFQVTMFTADGKELSGLVTFIPLKNHAEEDRIVVVVQDITELEKAKRRAVESMDMKETILSTLSEGLFVHNMEGEVIKVNESGARLLGLSKDEMNKVNPFDMDGYFVDENYQRLSNEELPAVQAIWNEQTYEDFSLGIVKSPLFTQWLSVNAAPFYVKGVLVGAVVTFSDVTEKRAQAVNLRETNAELKNAIEQAHEAIDMKTEFLSRMSHELRTPLNSILGYSELMLEGTDLQQRWSDKEVERLKKIHRSGEHLQHFISEVLDLSKVEMNRIDFRSEPVPLNTTIQEAFDIVSPYAQERNIDMEIVNDKSSESYVTGDRLFIRQTLVNLLQNAIKYNHENGYVKVSFDDHFDEVIILIEDNGIGISEEHVSKIFDSFYRVPSEYTGSGIGLSVVKQLVEKMGGETGVDSKPGEGSTFWVTLPDFKEEVKNTSNSRFFMLE